MYALWMFLSFCALLYVAIKVTTGEINHRRGRHR